MAVTFQGFMDEGAWLAARTGMITGSDLAAIIGVDPMRSAWHVWKTKVAPGEAIEVDATTAELLEGGKLAEPAMREWYRRWLEKDERGVALQRTRAKYVLMRDIDDDRLGGTPDDLAMAGDRIAWGVEFKNVNEFAAADWGEPGTDDVPERCWVQCQWYMDRLGVDRWDVVACFGGWRYRHYTVWRDKERGAGLRQIALAWWDSYVVTLLEPPVRILEAHQREAHRRDPDPRELATEASYEDVAMIARAAVLRDAKRVVEAAYEHARGALKDRLRHAGSLVLPGCGRNGQHYVLATYQRSKPAIEVDWQGVAMDLRKRMPGFAWTPETAAGQFADLVSIRSSRPDGKRLLYTKLSGPGDFAVMAQRARQAMPGDAAAALEGLARRLASPATVPLPDGTPLPYDLSHGDSNAA